MKIVITGVSGQLGSELARTAPKQWQVTGVDLPDWDVTQSSAEDELLRRRPHLVLNAAAYTAVDRAEEDRETAFAVNAAGAARVADACRRVGARLVHLSTDFVFDGTQGRPYRPDDTPKPLNVYGASKLEGEKVVREILGEGVRIVRTSWLYSRFGRNFVLTMLSLLRDRPQVKVVTDQVGTPTWAGDLARALWRLAELDWDDIGSVLHWSDAGVASWYDFALAIQEEATERGLLADRSTLIPISTADYPVPAAPRPFYSVLDKTDTWAWLGRRSRHWREALRDMLDELVVG